MEKKAILSTLFKHHFCGILIWSTKKIKTILVNKH